LKPTFFPGTGRKTLDYNTIQAKGEIWIFGYLFAVNSTAKK
jgi:hypothetical protein